MSKLEELIEQYCPDGVEYVPLSSIGTIKRGNGLQKKDFVKAGIGCIHYGQIYTKFGLFTNKTLTYVDKELADHLLHIEKGDLVIACTSENVEDVCKAVAWLGDDSIVTGGHSCVLHHNQNPKYIAYFFQTESFQRQKRKYAYGTKVIDIKPDSIGKIEIPLPPLPVQEEIVRILDAFTELQAELQAELQKRQQQYNFYRDNLLNFKNINRGGQEIKWMKLKDVATQWYRGAGIKREEVGNEGMPCIRYGEIHTSYNIWFKDCISHTDETKQATKKYAEYGDILFAITSEDIPLVGNSVAYLGKEKIMVGGDIVVMKHNQDPRYMAYALSTSDAIKQKGKGKVKSKVVHTNVPSLQEIVIPIPPMEEQQRIADILDRFDTLTNDLTSGLPAEMEKRRQQYEFYRDKLLTFKRKEA